MNANLWVQLLLAWSLVESSNNPNAFNAKEQAVGVLQIRQAALTDVNEHYGTTFTLEDMHNVTIARWVAVHYVKWYGYDTSFEAATKCFNAGPSWQHKTGAAKQRMENHWAKVKRQIESQE
jgi:hypothetical protein